MRLSEKITIVAILNLTTTRRGGCFYWKMCGYRAVAVIFSIANNVRLWLFAPLLVMCGYRSVAVICSITGPESIVLIWIMFFAVNLKKYDDQTCSCPKDWRLSASWAPDWASMVPGDASFSDSRCKFFQSGDWLHTEESCLNIVKSHRNKFVYTIFYLIWNQTDYRSVMILNRTEVHSVLN